MVKKKKNDIIQNAVLITSRRYFENNVKEFSEKLDNN